MQKWNAFSKAHISRLPTLADIFISNTYVQQFAKVDSLEMWYREYMYVCIMFVHENSFIYFCNFCQTL